MSIKRETKADLDEYGVLIFRLRHNELDVDELGNKTGFEVALSWRSDDLQDRGPDLPPRKRGENFWSSKFPLPEREFSNHINRILDAIKNHQTAFSEFVEAGGKIQIYLQLKGKKNIGDTISSNMAKDLYSLGVDLGIEVFPNYQ